MVRRKDGTTWGSLPIRGESILVPPSILPVDLIEEARVVYVEFERAGANDRAWFRDVSRY